MPSSNPKRDNRMPEIVVAGLIFAAGAFVWSQHLAPQPDPAPGLGANNTQRLMLPADWKTPSNAERLAAQKVIVAQLDAFKNKKWAQAITYQSKNLKKNFASTEAFRVMMITTYPQFVGYKAVKFGQARFDGTHLQVVAALTGKDGAKVNAVYMMVKEAGKYHVDGVGGGMVAPTPANQGTIA